MSDEELRATIHELGREVIVGCAALVVAFVLGAVLVWFAGQPV